MNELTLCVVNEGADYQNRLETARMRPAARFVRWSRRVDQEVCRQWREFDRREFTVAEMAQAVVELDHYYQQHIAEM